MTVHKDMSLIFHPEYLHHRSKWEKYRRTFEAGATFIERYLVRFSERESHTDFVERKKITYVPAFAKAAVNEVKNAVFQRMADISRVGGPSTYQDSIHGLAGGVDNMGATMNSFIGRYVLPELLVMGRVGIFVDMPPVLGPSLVEQQGIHPYLYVYKAEEIKSWAHDNQGNLVGVLLEQHVWDWDIDTYLPNGDVKTNHLFLFIDHERDFQVVARFYDDKGQIDREVILEGLRRIPFVFVDIGQSLLSDVADYQIAMMNLASSDLSYALKSNYPFYIEQYDPRADNPFAKRDVYDAEEQFEADADGDGQPEDKQGQQRDFEIEMGSSAGRRYPISVKNAPDFIHPSPEPLKVSMEKQTMLKEEIRLLVNLAVSNLKGASNVSAEAKREDQSGLESGLSFIGLTLEQAEREIAEIWSDYENSDNVASVKYPEKYSLRSEADRRADAENMADMMAKVPSITYKREMAKRIAELMLGSRTSHQDMMTVFDEIDAAPYFEPEPENIHRDVEQGLVSRDFASEVRGYPDGESEKAAAEHVERATVIAMAQSAGSNSDNPAARGVPDLAVDPRAEADAEKSQSQDRDQNVERRTRGRGR